jgi:hypothetical protein
MLNEVKGFPKREMMRLGAPKHPAREKNQRWLPFVAGCLDCAGAPLDMTNLALWAHRVQTQGASTG